MPRICTVCNNPRREEINFDLLAHEVPYSTMAKKFGVSEDSLKRHVANHLKPLIQKVNHERESKDIDTILKARDVFMTVMRKLPEVIDHADINQVIRAAEAYARISGEDALPSQVIFVWGKGLEKEDDMELTNDLKQFDVKKSRDRAEEPEDAADAETPSDSAPV